MAISINKVSEEVKLKIIEDYKNNFSLRAIEEKYNVSRNTISKYLEKIGVKNTKGNHYRIYFHNEDFFEVIDNEEKAYWLGFMFADGYILDNTKRYGQDSFGVCLAIDSMDSLEKFKKSLGATNPITFDNSKGTGQTQCRLLMRSQKTVDDLIDKGCVKRKSLVLEPPKKVPEFLLHHFIRGFFDGDGSITKNARKNGTFAYGVNFTSTYEMVKWIQDYFGKGSIFKDQRTEHTWGYVLGGNLQTLEFCNIIYKDATIWMDRKYTRYKELLDKYSES